MTVHPARPAGGTVARPDHGEVRTRERFRVDDRASSGRSLTPGLVELARQSIESANSGDYDLMMSFYRPDAVFDALSWGLGTHEGSAAIRTFLRDWLGAFDEFELELEEVREFGNGVVFAVARQDARPASSNNRLQLRYAAVSVWVEGAIERVTNYRDIEQARMVADQLGASTG